MGYGVLNQRGDYGVTRRRGDAFLPAILGGVSLVKRGIGLLSRAKKVGKVAAPLATAGGIAMSFRGPPPGGIPTPGLRGKVQRILPGGQTGYYKRRRMNVANPKALKRAIRREQGFIKLARRTLKGTGFVITRRGMGGKRKAFGRK